MKAHKHAALLGDVAHREARAVTVSPELAVERRQNRLGHDLSDVPERIGEHGLLEVDLRGRVKMLHGAAAAAAGPDAEIGTARRHALRARLENFSNAPDREAGLAAQLLIAHALGGQRPFDEDDLAVAMRNAAPVDVELLDVDFVLRADFFLTSAHEWCSFLSKRAPPAAEP